MKRFTAKEIAEKFKVEKISVQKWIQRNLFPNAYKENVAPFGEIWYVPASDIENFERPQRGRPKENDPTPATISKRNLRDNKREKKAA